MSSTSRDPDARRGARHLLRRVRAARDAGLDTLTFGDSHARAGAHYFQNTPTVGRALAEWDPARAAGCLFLVPMWPPVLLAEQVGTLAAFHDGPFVVQTGLGSPAEFARFGVEVEHRGRALDESIRIVRALFAGEVVSSDLYGITEARLGLVPPNDVDWWVGTMSETGLERAARLGATWYASHGAAGDRLRTMVESYSSACAEHGTQPSVAVRREVVVLSDGDQARKLAGDMLAAGYRGMRPEMVLSGTPDDVASEMAELAALGTDEVMCRTMGIDEQTDLETIERLGEVRSLLSRLGSDYG